MAVHSKCFSSPTKIPRRQRQLSREKMLREADIRASFSSLLLRNMPIWLFVSSVCLGASLKPENFEELGLAKIACNGTRHESYLPFTSSKIQKITFSPAYSDKDMKTLYKNSEFVNPGYSFGEHTLRITEVTPDHQGMYMARLSDESERKVLNLTVKACNDQKILEHEDSLLIYVVEKPQVFKFFPKDSPSQPEVLWHHEMISSPVEVTAAGSPPLESWLIKMENMTSSDEGDYEVLGDYSNLIYRTHVTVMSQFPSEGRTERFGSSGPGLSGGDIAALWFIVFSAALCAQCVCWMCGGCKTGSDSSSDKEKPKEEEEEFVLDATGNEASPDEEDQGPADDGAASSMIGVSSASPQVPYTANEAVPSPLPSGYPPPPVGPASGPTYSSQPGPQVPVNPGYSLSLDSPTVGVYSSDKLNFL